MTTLLGVLKLCEEITPRDLTQRSRKHLPGQKVFAGANKLPQKSCPLVQRGEGGWRFKLLLPETALMMYTRCEGTDTDFPVERREKEGKKGSDLIPEKYERFAFSRFAWLFPSTKYCFYNKRYCKCIPGNWMLGRPSGVSR